MPVSLVERRWPGVRLNSLRTVCNCSLFRHVGSSRQNLWPAAESSPRKAARVAPRDSMAYREKPRCLSPFRWQRRALKGRVFDRLRQADTRKQLRKKSGNVSNVSRASSGSCRLQLAWSTAQTRAMDVTMDATALQTRFDLFGGAEELPPSLRARSKKAADLSRTDSGVSMLPGGSSDESADEATTRATTPGLEEDVKVDEEAVPQPRGLEWAPREIQPPLDGTDFLWSLTEEPHRSRRKAILKAHPEVSAEVLAFYRPPNCLDSRRALAIVTHAPPVRPQVTKLMGHEPLTKWVVLFVTLVQFSTAYYLRNTPFWSWKFWILAYVIGGTANQNTFLAVHEITHNLAFRGVRANRIFAILTNLPIGVPFAMMFKKYHIEHHKVSFGFLLGGRCADGRRRTVPGRRRHRHRPSLPARVARSANRPRQGVLRVRRPMSQLV